MVARASMVTPMPIPALAAVDRFVVEALPELSLTYTFLPKAGMAEHAWLRDVQGHKDRILI